MKFILNLLLPKWTFFDDIDVQLLLYYREFNQIDGQPSAQINQSLNEPQKWYNFFDKHCVDETIKLKNIFINEQINLRHYYNSLLVRLVNENIDAANSIYFEIIKNYISTKINKNRSFQFKVVALDLQNIESDLIISDRCQGARL